MTIVSTAPVVKTPLSPKVIATTLASFLAPAILATLVYLTTDAGKALYAGVHPLLVVFLGALVSASIVGITGYLKSDPLRNLGAAAVKAATSDAVAKAEQLTSGITYVVNHPPAAEDPQVALSRAIANLEAAGIFAYAPRHQAPETAPVEEEVTTSDSVVNPDEADPTDPPEIVLAEPVPDELADLYPDAEHKPSAGA